MNTVSSICRFSLAAALTLAACGCQNATQQNPSSSGGGNSILGGLAKPPVTAPPESDLDQYTILLRKFGGEGRVQAAELYRKHLTENEGWRNVYILHKADSSELCWGTHPTIKDAQGDLQKARAFSVRGERIFELAVVVVLPGKDVGPPEWNVSNAKGFYTVLVAEFYDVPEAQYVGRKSFAVKYCEQLRKEGMEAYYMHGPSKSFVYVGSFPESAIRKVELQDEMARPVVQDRNMIEIMRKIPLLAVNGNSQRLKTVDATGKPVNVDIGSYPVPIPRRGADTSGDAITRPGNPKPQ